MKKLSIITVVLFLIGCGGFNQAEKFSAKTNKPVKITRVKKVDVSYDKDAEKDASLREGMWTEAEKKGMQKINKSWVKQRLLVPISNATIFDHYKEKFLERQGEITFPESEEDILPSKQFEVSASFTPVNQVRGKVVDIEQDGTLAGKGTEISIEFQDLNPTQKGTYFLVTRPERVEKKSYVRVIGSGKIYNAMKDLSQAVLQKSSQEIMEGDRVYILQTKVSSLQEEKEEKEVNATEIDVKDKIIVEPVPEPEKKAPKGSK